MGASQVGKNLKSFVYCKMFASARNNLGKSGKYMVNKKCCESVIERTIIFKLGNN